MSSAPFALETKSRRPSSSRREAEQLLDRLEPRVATVWSDADENLVWVNPVTVLTSDLHHSIEQNAHELKLILRARRRAVGLLS